MTSIHLQHGECAVRATRRTPSLVVTARNDVWAPFCESGYRFSVQWLSLLEFAVVPDAAGRKLAYAKKHRTSMYAYIPCQKPEMINYIIDDSTRTTATVRGPVDTIDGRLVIDLERFDDSPYYNAFGKPTPNCWADWSKAKIAQDVTVGDAPFFMR